MTASCNALVIGGQFGLTSGIGGTGLGNSSGLMGDKTESMFIPPTG